MKTISAENYIGIKQIDREILESWLRVAEAENAGHDIAYAAQRHAEFISRLCGESVDVVFKRTVRALNRNRAERDSEYVLRRLRVAARPVRAAA